MLLESISLQNFRQFRNETVEFARGDDGKNVTIILGENGTGKTTFAQAFFWCMYGETVFSDKVMLNRLVATELRPGQEARVKVTLKLQHGEVFYALIREQVYRKDTMNRVKGDNTIFDIQRKAPDGNTEYVKKSMLESEVNIILRKELSKYFFFDGERIERMSKDISTGTKVTDFADAVKGLLGLNAMFSAIQHLKPTSQGVIGSYDKSYDSHSDSKIQEYSRIIEECRAKITQIDTRIEELDTQIELAQARKIEKTEELKLYADGEKLQSEKERLISQMNRVARSKSNVFKQICGDFNTEMGSFFSVRLIVQALQMLSAKDFAGKDIPFMRDKTIEYLLKQKVCICGTHLDEGSLAYQKVKGLIDFLPPKSLSTSISDFKKESRRRIAETQQDLYALVRDNLAIISQQEEEWSDLSDDLHEVEKKLSGGDVRGKVRAINGEIQICDQNLRRDKSERDRCLGEKGAEESRLERADSERRKLTLLDDKNKKIEIYKAYAERIYKELWDTYKKSEAAIRERLEDTINGIFRRIYEGGLSLTIDENYRISVYADDFDGDVETSTAQSISVIFAFISGIIKMARENRNATDADAQLLSSEPYPLVMDAPLSAFDKRRIKTICKALPETAEQVIIFIKDTDGDLAEEYMGERIGSRHRFDKINEFETVLA